MWSQQLTVLPMSGVTTCNGTNIQTRGTIPRVDLYHSGKFNIQTKTGKAEEY